MTDQPAAKSTRREQFRLKFRRYFLAGLAALLPIILTLFIVVQIYRWIVPSIVWALGEIISWFVGGVTPMPVPGESPGMARLRAVAVVLLESTAAQTVLSILLAIVIVYVVGYVVSSYMGQMLFDSLDKLLKRFPIVKVIYPYAKQFTDSIFSNDKTSKFRKVVAIQYPRVGMYALGFLMGEGVKELTDRAGRRLVTVFVPSAPTPVMGWVALVPEDEVINLDLTVDGALRMIISLGILGPTEPMPGKELPFMHPKDVAGPSPEPPAKE